MVVTDDSDGFDLVRRKVTKTRKITAELTITETIEEFEKPTLKQKQLLDSKPIQFVLFSIILDIAGNLLATSMQLGFLLQNIVPYMVLNLVVAFCLVYLANRGWKKHTSLLENDLEATSFQRGKMKLTD